MTVTIENLGGGRSGTGNFPFDLARMLDFEDDFHRPLGEPLSPSIYCNGLGPDWLVQWLTTENRDSPINAIITDDNKCNFIPNDPATIPSPPGIARTIWTPRPTAWIGACNFLPRTCGVHVGKGQYAELTVNYIPSVNDCLVGPVCNWSGNLGTGHYLAGCQSQPGFFFLLAYTSTPTTTSNRLFYVGTYGMTNLNPVPGTQASQILSLPDAPLDTVLRLETRFLGDFAGDWQLRCLFDGDLVGETQNPALYAGSPGMSCWTNGTTGVTDPIAKVGNFKCGWLSS